MMVSRPASRASRGFGTLSFNKSASGYEQNESEAGKPAICIFVFASALLHLCAVACGSVFILRLTTGYCVAYYPGA